MAFEELLEWSGNRSDWQQDALRRIAENNSLSDEDLESLSRMIESAAGLPADEVEAPIPLVSQHLSSASSEAPKTILGSLGPTKYVDRLDSEQDPLKFAIEGITLVYGENASGKSGYCRIAKQLCRSLAPVDLKGNIYDEDQCSPASVGVAYKVGQENKVEMTWTDGEDPPFELARISVFDSDTARVYVDSNRKIEYLPYELDLMNKLGLGVRAIDGKFRSREELLDDSIAGLVLPEFSEGTIVSTQIRKLVPGSKLADLPSEEKIMEIGDWTEDFQNELKSLREAVSNSPEVAISRRNFNY